MCQEVIGKTMQMPDVMSVLTRSGVATAGSCELCTSRTVLKVAVVLEAELIFL